ncbi:MAG: hypothetical protein FJX74_15930, partial [Armatimonadetes bacterium]|nr:hypothetical protein [Armatimonadota bacterium]
MLVAIATLLALCYASLWAGPAHEPGVLGFLTLMAVAFALYAIACRVARRVPEHPALAIILGGAVLFRALTAGPVLFDDDLYRYHWDGKVLASGRNPYAYAPNDHRLGGLRDDAW